MEGSLVILVLFEISNTYVSTQFTIFTYIIRVYLMSCG